MVTILLGALFGPPAVCVGFLSKSTGSVQLRRGHQVLTLAPVHEWMPVALKDTLALGRGASVSILAGNQEIRLTGKASVQLNEDTMRKIYNLISARSGVATVRHKGGLPPNFFTLLIAENTHFTPGIPPLDQPSFHWLSGRSIRKVSLKATSSSAAKAWGPITWPASAGSAKAGGFSEWLATLPRGSLFRLTFTSPESKAEQSIRCQVAGPKELPPLPGCLSPARSPDELLEFSRRKDGYVARGQSWQMVEYIFQNLHRRPKSYFMNFWARHYAKSLKLDSWDAALNDDKAQDFFDAWMGEGVLTYGSGIASNP